MAHTHTHQTPAVIKDARAFCHECGQVARAFTPSGGWQPVQPTTDPRDIVYQVTDGRDTFGDRARLQDAEARANNCQRLHGGTFLVKRIVYAAGYASIESIDTVYAAS